METTWVDVKKKEEELNVTCQDVRFCEPGKTYTPQMAMEDLGEIELILRRRENNG